MLAVLTFPEAMAAAQATAAKIARKGWNGPGQYVRIAHSARLSFRAPDGATAYHDARTGFAVLRNTQGEYVPWAPSQGDMMATDWMVLP
jgi:hypothetical protein